jgi:1-acyl-sn-glycerol-3-phosphate acyltransferase
MIGAFMYFCLWFPLNTFRKLWWRWSIEGTENLPPRPQGGVLAANHINWTDPHILGASLPLSHRPWWLAKVELFNTRFGAWWFHEMQVIPIRRGKRDLAALETCERELKSGGLLVIFPEGHRSRTGGLQEAKPGAARLAVRSGTPIVPIAIWGTEHGFRGAMSRKQITVRIGKPYYIENEGDRISADRMAFLTEEIMLRIAELLPEQYWGVYREKMEARRTGGTLKTENSEVAHSV